MSKKIRLPGYENISGLRIREIHSENYFTLPLSVFNKSIETDYKTFFI